MLQQQCCAFEIFPDHSHVSMFPVNCTAKYWGRALCDDGHNTIRTYDITGVGEYWINNHSFFQREYICPDGFDIIVANVCIRLILLENNFTKHKAGVKSNGYPVCPVALGNLIFRSGNFKLTVQCPSGNWAKNGSYYV